MSDLPKLPKNVLDGVKSLVEGAPVQRDLDIRITESDGRVIMRFSHTIHWFPMDPEMAVNIAEAIITAAVAAKKHVETDLLPGVAPKSKLILPGLSQ